MKEAAFSESELAATGPWGHIKGVLLVMIGTFILLRWLLIQGLAFAELNRIRRSHPVESDTLPFVSIQVITGGKISLWRDYSNMDTLLSKAPKWWLEHIMQAWAEQT